MDKLIIPEDLYISNFEYSVESSNRGQSKDFDNFDNINQIDKIQSEKFDADQINSDYQVEKLEYRTNKLINNYKMKNNDEFINSQSIDYKNLEYDNDLDNEHNLYFSDDESEICDADIINIKPIFKTNNNIITNLWKNIIINTDVSILYINNLVEDSKLSEDFRHSIVISLLSWSEMDKYNGGQFQNNVMASGKIFIHFPLYKSSRCHNYISRSQCIKFPCGKIAPFCDMKTVTTLINNYMNKGERVLIYCHKNINMILLFCGCCMIQGNCSYEKVLSLMMKYNLKYSYGDYIESFLKYLM